MPHWIATHDPHDSLDKWYVYLKKKVRKGGLPIPGDSVLFYETENLGPDRKPGRKAMICAAEVIGTVAERVPPNDKWLYEIPCGSPVQAKQRVDRNGMLNVLQLPASFPVMNFQGLKQIDEAQYVELRRMMGL